MPVPHRGLHNDHCPDGQLIVLQVPTVRAPEPANKVSSVWPESSANLDVALYRKPHSAPNICRCKIVPAAGRACWGQVRLSTCCQIGAGPRVSRQTWRPATDCSSLCWFSGSSPCCASAASAPDLGDQQEVVEAPVRLIGATCRVRLWTQHS